MIHELEHKKGARSAEASGTSAKSKKRAYVKVPSEKKKELVELMETKRWSTKAAAELLGVNYSAAKHILKLHKQEKGLISPINKSSLPEDLGVKRSGPEDLKTSIRTPELSFIKLPSLTPCSSFPSILLNEYLPTFDFSVYSSGTYERYHKSIKE
eukprot:TRINITY_DN3281_c0_g1_i1.p1 TRINITY_DN3281_c0_g1~~TRINITY_DN3281_c0_g1_i1.p1  ORF type:complete len:155 (+),score=34.11 TRINITY_DN3281_c0_g1_i1:163-627(+)